MGRIYTCERWTISGLNSSWNYSKVEFRAYCEGITGIPVDLDLNRFGTDDGGENPDDWCPEDEATLFAKCHGTEYTDIASGDISASSWLDWTDLGSTALSDLESAVDDGDTYWALGLTEDSPNATDYYAFSEYDEANDAELRITYTEGRSTKNIEKWNLGAHQGEFLRMATIK